MSYQWQGYVDSYLRTCGRYCFCNTEPCGYDHEPCAIYQNPKPDGTHTKGEFICYCPTVIDDAARLLLLAIANYGAFETAESFAGYESLGELIGREGRQTRRICNELVLKKILLVQTCEMMQCTGNHRQKHILINPKLPGIPAFLTLYPSQDRGYKPRKVKNPAKRKKMEGLS